MEIRPQAPRKLFFSEILDFYGEVFEFRFQRALKFNHPQTLSLSQVMLQNILSKKLSLGLNFSTPSGGVTSPSLKASMVCTVYTHSVSFRVVLVNAQTYNDKT